MKIRMKEEIKKIYVHEKECARYNSPVIFASLIMKEKRETVLQLFEVLIIFRNS